LSLSHSLTLSLPSLSHSLTLSLSQYLPMQANSDHGWQFVAPSTDKLALLEGYNRDTWLELYSLPVLVMIMMMMAFGLLFLSFTMVNTEEKDVATYNWLR